MAEKIRLRVWLLGLAPIVVAGGVFALLALPRSEHHRAAGDGVATPGAAPDPSPAGAPLSSFGQPVPAPSTGGARPPPSQPTVAMSLNVDAYGSVRGPPPEPIPELDPVSWRPPGSSDWTADQKAAYRQRMFQQLDDRERLLQKEIAAAHRAGDTDTEQRKTLTLSYLQKRRTEIQSMIQRSTAAASAASAPPAPSAPPSDTGDSGP